MTVYTGNAFVTTTKTNIDAAKYLIEEQSFKFVLPAVFSQSPLEKFFGQARQRKGGNFYIDLTDVLAASKVQGLHTLIKLDLKPVGTTGIECELCPIDPLEEDLEHLSTVKISDSQTLVTKSIFKEKIVYIAGYLTYKNKKCNNGCK